MLRKPDGWEGRTAWNGREAGTQGRADVRKRAKAANRKRQERGRAIAGGAGVKEEPVSASGSDEAETSRSGSA